MSSVPTVRLVVALCALVALVRGSTPYNPSDEVFTHSLGGHIATTLGQFKQLNAPLAGLTKEETNAEYELASQCDPKLGYLWEPKGGISPSKPISLYYTAQGQLAGMRVDIFGEKAAQGRQISEGYWIPTGEPNQWHMSVSFRAPEAMCSDWAALSEPVGDRVVINQDTIAKSIPVTAAQAEEMKFMPGSCMKSMGQHWFYDLEDAPGNSWNSGNLLPITPMYNMKTGILNAFFFSAPVCQGKDGHGSSTAYNWDNVPSIIGCALPPAAMCQNFCTSKCSNSLLWGSDPWKSSGTKHYATLHVFFNKDPKNEPTCPEFSESTWVTNPAGASPHCAC